MSLNEIEDDKPWYQSRVIWGGIIAILTPLASLLGVEIAPDTASDIASLATAAGGVVGGGLAIWGRMRATKPIGRSTPSPRP